MLHSALHTLDSERQVTDPGFRSLFDFLPVAVHEIDNGGRVVRVNEAECNHLGYGAEQMIGRPVWQFIAPEQREAGRRAVLRKLARKQPLVPFERQYVHRDGRLLTFQVYDAYLRNSAGAATGIRSILLDVTERRELFVLVVEQRAELARIAAALEKLTRIALPDTRALLHDRSGYADLLAARYGDKLDAEAIKSIGRALQNAGPVQQSVA